MGYPRFDMPNRKTTNKYVTCVIPALNEEANIGKVIDIVKEVKEIDDIIVVDDGSTDETPKIARENGARCIQHPLNLGKGAAMRSGVEGAKNNFVVFVDADLENFSARKVRKLIRPLLNDEADFVKAAYHNPSGRTTKLVAKPLLKILYPFLEIEYPLSGEIALNRKKFRFENLEQGWGVDIQLVLQAARRKLRMKEVHLGRKEHKHHDLDALSKQAEEVMHTILSELRLIAHKHKIIFFDLDKTLISESSIRVIAREWDFEEELDDLFRRWEAKEIPDKVITQTLARHFKGKTKSEINAICSTIEINPFAKKVISQLRRQRFRVRIVSSAYSPVVEYFAQRLGVADFICPRLQFGKDGRYTGTLRKSRFEDIENNCCGMYVCKRKAVEFVRKRFGMKEDECMAVGDGKSDKCMFDACGCGLGYGTDMTNRRIESLCEVLMYVE
jgi:HAD superfamily phosphoserine phosphatase-like hydrolase